MLVQLIIFQSIAHLLGDFVFQTQNLSDNKEKRISIYHVYHALIIGLFSYTLSFDLGFWWVTLLLTLTHFLIDVLKTHLVVRAKKKGKSINYFFVDQFAHLFLIVLFVLLYNHFCSINFYFTIPDIKVLFTVFIFLFCTKPSNIVIKNLFHYFQISTPIDLEQNAENKSLENAGKLIGIMERMITLVLIIKGQYEAVGLVIAAKSILRLNNTSKSEYVLMGTLLSFGIAIFGGILINMF